MIRRNAFVAAFAVAALLAAPAFAQGRLYKIVGVGDVMLGSDYPGPVMDARVTPDADPARVLGPELARILKSADVTFGNMEGTLHTSNDGAKRCGNPKFCYTFRGPPWHAQFLRRVGFTMMSQANNHAGDFGAHGRVETFRNLQRAGIVSAGTDMDGMRTGIQTLKDGTKVGLAAFGHNPGLIWNNDYRRIRAIVQSLKRQANIVVVSCHAGAEGGKVLHLTRNTEIFLGENRGDVYRFAHTAVDAGADIVFCQGPHVSRAIEVYKGRFIAYSLGNFWTYGRFNLNGHQGMAPIAELEVDKTGRLHAARIISARQTMPGGPKFDPSGAAARQIAELTASDIPEARIAIAPDGRVSWPGMPRR
ncbi:MAG: CapA family protein [Rhodospirillaceae bacterium]|nr:CapA family protein [Rhodospirillaceae bacterium]